MEKLIGYISRSLVGDPEAVTVSQIQKGTKTIIKLGVAEEDMGRIIGKRGRVANSLRSLLRVVASRQGKHAVLDIVEPRRP